MRKFFKDYFSFTRTESRIILVLSGVLLLITVIRIHSDTIFPDVYEPSKEEIKEIEDFIASLEKKNYENKDQKVSRVEEHYKNLMVFNPNKVLVREMKEMGFPENVISNISKYRNAGGHFSKVDDIKKIYGITENSFIKISPYILINDSISNYSINVKKSIRVENISININTADSMQLESLNGIGSAFASRIIKYRKKLGGFINPEQLLEIYGFDSSIFLSIKKNIYIDTINIRKIDLNTITLSELEKHPYIDKFTASSIIKFRNFKGKDININDLITNDIIEKERLTKIKPYLMIKP